ncbi:transporter [Flavobacterium aquicola]|uniref:Outer membrane putative beta-barrel porin/alpha-amylase n=1 Tax=Flavobacterium aquicola TaxID=1682742 RepID=A0A3E0EUT2_9FLAO|nr:transporter [Flavobacterium aquicola]REH01936.1 outer membrane putative beta-barrel porin/alpha-amylase [Flavobacterium aquicola]
MFNIKNALFAILFLIPLAHYGQHTDEINSNRPGESMSAFAVGKTVIQVETGVFGIKESHDLARYNANGFGVDMELRYGAFLENLEFIADIQYVYETFNYPMMIDDRADFKQSVLGAKYLIYDPNKGYKKEANIYSWKANNKFNWHQIIPAVAVFAGANFTGKNNPFYFSPDSEISPKVGLILQNHLGDGSWVFVTNVLYNYIATDYPSLSYILTLTKGINKNWSAFVENQGIKSDFYSDAIVRGGAAYLINKNLQVDASISTNFKDTPSMLYGGVGVSWRYDGRYKEVRLLSKEEENEKIMGKKTNK